MTRRARYQKPPSVSEALNKIRLESKELKASGTLKKLQSRQYEAALDTLRQPQGPKKRDLYKLFLQDLLRCASDVGHTLIMLCAVALGQARIANMNKSDRSILQLELVNLSQELCDPVLRLLAHTGKSACPTNGM
jgi:hypothetical protein